MARAAESLPPVRLPWWFWPAAAFLVAYPLLTLAPGFPFGEDERFIDGSYAVRLALVSAVLAWAGLRADLPARLRRSLLVAGAGTIPSVVKQVLVTADPHLLTGGLERIHLFTFVFSYFCAMAALLLYPRLPLRRSQAWSIAIDVLVSVGSLGVLSWVLSGVPALEKGGVAAAWAVFEGLAQVFVLVGLNVLVILGQALPSRRAFWWFVASEAMYLPVVYLGQAPSDVPGVTFLADLCYFAGAIPTLVAAVLIRADPLSPAPRGGSPRWLLDLNPVALASPLALGAFLVAALAEGAAGRALTLGTALVAASALLGLRLLLAALENARLVREEREAERRAQAEKMESVSRLAGGIAHEFNNLMATVVATASVGAREAPPDGTAREDFDTIKLAGQRAAALTRQLEAFAGRPTDARRPVDVAAAVAGLAPRLREAAGPAVDLRISAEPTPPALADPDQLWTVLSHLTANGAQAMPSGGTLSVTVRPEVLDAPLASPFLAAPAGAYVALAVSDTGPGIAPDVLPRIFDPFFSTRPIFEAKGLGLAEVHGIVSAHGGGLAVETAPGRGSTFTVYLPVA